MKTERQRYSAFAGAVDIQPLQVSDAKAIVVATTRSRLIVSHTNDRWLDILTGITLLCRRNSTETAVPSGPAKWFARDVAEDFC